jgi:hypothetical protein
MNLERDKDFECRGKIAVKHREKWLTDVGMNRQVLTGHSKAIVQNFPPILSSECIFRGVLESAGGFLKLKRENCRCYSI